MNTKSFENIVNEAWNNKNQINSKSSRKILNAISKSSISKMIFVFQLKNPN